MYFISSIKRSILNTVHRLQENTLDSLLWIVNVVPSFAGFSILKEKIKVPFWIGHLLLLFYVYGVGIVVYQVKYANGAQDFTKNYVNVSLFILIANNSYWWIKKRPLLRAVLAKINESDEMAHSSVMFQEKHSKLMSTIKRIVLIFYGANMIDAVFIYLPNRVDVRNSYSMTACVGLGPLTSTPNREICLTILCLQEFSIMIVCLNYQALLILLIAHTALMYQMLSEEMMSFNNIPLDVINEVVKQKLPSLINRHAIILDIIDKLKSLYSMPIGVNFGSNAVCICLFFYLPLRECVKFIPVLIYCFLVFFLYCFLCQRLINTAEEFERAVYSCGWENFDVRHKKCIYVVLRQAQKPVQLLAADIIPVNIYTFAATLQAMFKFVTVVKF